MITPISNTTSITQTHGASPSMGDPPQGVGALPPPTSDALHSMLSSGDIGSEVAAMIMMNEKNNRDAARNARDASYRSMEAQQAKQLGHMSAAAAARFGYGLLQGGLELGSAGCSFAGAFSAANSGTSRKWTAVGEGAHATSGVATAIGKGFGDHFDRMAKADEQHADEFKRVAEDHKDDVDDANKGVDKAMQFYQDWISSRSAEQAAALHRS